VVPEFLRDDLRELVEPPYRIIYRIYPDAVEVLAIAHGRQDVRERS
jgi:plasmid stabilization system protein ParE